MMKRSCFFTLLTVLLCLCLCAHADEACLTIPAGTTAIETEAFYGDSSLQTVILPEGLLTIGPRAFANSGVSAVNLPGSLTEIADDAFDGCEGVVATVVAGSAGETFVKEQGIEYRYDVVASPVEDFEYEIFDGEVTITGYLGSDTEVVIPSEIDGKPVTTIEACAFQRCYELESVHIPSGVEVIDEYAFDGCSKLQNVQLPSTLKEIYGHAFDSCTSLTEIHLPDSITRLASKAFNNCSNLSKVNYPLNWNTTYWANSRSYDTPFYNCPKLTSIVIPEGVTKIPYEAFSCCSSLTTVSLPSSLTTIGSYAFRRCFELISISIPSGVEVINENTFDGCSKLQNVQLPSTLKEIYGHAFDSCTSLTEIHLPDSITRLASKAFNNCSNLSKVNYPLNWNTTYWANSRSYDTPFYNCPKLTSIVIPEGVTKIPYEAFSCCSSLACIAIPNSAINISIEVFSNCPNLTIYGEPGSYAETYANEQNIPFSTDPFPGYLEKDIWITSTGSVYLHEGIALPGATVTLYLNDSITPVASTVTNQNGNWSIQKLLPDTTYRFSCSYPLLAFDDIYVTTPSTADAIATVPSIVANTAEDYLISKQTVLRAEATASTLYLDIISSGSWNAVSNEDWLALSATPGEAPGDSISVSFEENPDILRVGEIVISTETQSLLIPVVQPGAAGARLPEPTITTPAEDGLELPYDAVEVIWDAVENADYYVVSLRDLTTDTLLLHHEKQAENSGCRALLPAEYFFMGREYRIAVGAVPRGLDSSDPAVGWCERTFKTPAALLATDASISGRICEYEYISEEYDENGNVITQAAIHYLPLSSVTVNLFKITESEKINIGSMVTSEDGAFAFTQCEIGQTYIIELQSTDTEFAALSKEEILSIQERTATTVDLEDAVYSLYTDAGENTTGDITGIPKLGDGHQSWYRSCIAGKPHGLWAEYFQFRDGNKNNAFTGVNKRWQYGYSPYDFKDGQLKAAYQNCYIGEIDFRWTNDGGDRNFDYLVTTNYDGSGSELMIRYLRTKNFAARFNGYLQVPTTDIYTFRLTGDDGINLSLKYAVVEGSTEVLKEYGGKKWHNGFAKSVTTKGMPLSAGSIMPLLIEYYNSDGVAKLKFEYKTQSDNNWRIVPAEWLYMGNNTCLVDGSWITPVQTMAEIDEQVHSAFDSMTDQVLGNYIDKIVTETIKPTVFAKWDDQISETWVQEVICSGYQGVARTAFDLIYSTIVDAALDPSTLTLDQIWKSIVAEIPCVKEYGESYGLDLEEVGEDAFEVVVKVMHIAYEHDPFTYQKLKIKLEDIILYDQMEKSMTGEVASSTLLDKMGTFSTAGKLVDMFHTNYKRAKEELDMNRLRSYIHLTIMENREAFEQSPPNGPIVNGSNLYQQMICTQIIETASFGGRNSTRPLPDQGSGKYYVSALDNASDFDLYLWFNQYYNRNEVEVMLYKQLLIDTVNMAGEVYGEILP